MLPLKKFYRVVEDVALGYTGDLSNAGYKLGLPGMECPNCGIVGGWTGLQYPCVDLSALPAEEFKKLSNGWPVPLEEFERRRELVRPLVPSHVLLKTGTEFGPLTGTGSGSFGQFFMQNPWSLFVRREALERLQSTGLSGLEGCPLNVRFRGKSPPELWELQLVAQGRLHPDCWPPGTPSPCSICGRSDVARPELYWLEAASLPEPLDVFRVADSPSLIIATQRMVDAVGALKLDGVVFQQVEAR